MPMPAYPVLCYAPGCTRPAAFKVAACWSDGSTEELKTYALACSECLETLYGQAVVQRAACRLAPGETLHAPAIYELNRGGRDKSLKRRPELEAQITS